MNQITQEQHRLAFRETLAKTGHDTLKALLIVSGGAAVAYLAFLGNAFADANRFQTIGSQAATTLILAMQHYVYSVASALLSYGATYFSHGAYYFNFDRTGHITMTIAVLLGLTCLGLFVYGSLEAAAGFRQAASSVLLKP
jgi:hypothetical protein